MKWAENNPVVSAFGIWNSDSGRRTINFTRGINNNLCINNNNIGLAVDDASDKASESVITIGGSSTYNDGGGSNKNYTRNGSAGSSNNYIRQNSNNGGGGLPYVQRSRRRKQPLPPE